MTVPHLYRVVLPVSDIDLAAKFYGYVFQDDGQRVSRGRHYFDCDGVTRTPETGRWGNIAGKVC
jgi:hypothetical protein